VVRAHGAATATPFHLTPPVTRTETIVTRFAPLQTNPSRFGILSTPKHHRCYDCLFSQDFLTSKGFNLDNYGYYFDRNFAYDCAATPYYWSLLRKVDRWKKQHRERAVDLSWTDSGAGVVVLDSRRDALPVERRISGLEKELFLACTDTPVRKSALTEKLSTTSDKIESAIRSLDQQELIWTEGDFILGLAIPGAIVQEHRSRNWQQQWTALYS
jgi:hypothetical protein